jgi:hypothetical protein
MYDILYSGVLPPHPFFPILISQILFNFVLLSLEYILDFGSRSSTCSQTMKAKQERHDTLKGAIEILNDIKNYIMPISSALKIVQAYLSKDGRQGVQAVEMLNVTEAEYVTYMTLIIVLHTHRYIHNPLQEPENTLIP